MVRSFRPDCGTISLLVSPGNSEQHLPLPVVNSTLAGDAWSEVSTKSLRLGAAFADRLRAVDAAVRDADIENAPIRTLLAHGAPCLQDRCRLGHQDTFARVRDGLNDPLPEQGSGSITATRIFSRPLKPRAAVPRQPKAGLAQPPTLWTARPGEGPLPRRGNLRLSLSRQERRKSYLWNQSTLFSGSKVSYSQRGKRPRGVALPEKRLAARAVVRPSVKSRRSGQAPPTFNRGLDGPVRDVPPAGHCPLLLARWPIALAHHSPPSPSSIALARHAGRRRRPFCVPVRRPGEALQLPRRCASQEPPMTSTPKVEARREGGNHA